jgi:DNA-binding NtrC family response regulator
VRGNVRELQHVIERAVLLCKGGRISELNVPQNFTNPISLASIQKNGMLATAAASSAGTGNQTMSERHAGFFPPQVNLDGEALFAEVGKFIVEKLPEPEDGAVQKDIFDSLENGIVTAALRRTNGNKQAAANLLGLYRPRLYGMIKRHSIDEKAQTS